MLFLKNNIIISSCKSQSLLQSIKSASKEQRINSYNDLFLKQ